MHKVYKLEPEIILEGGDPNKLPLEIRKEILRSVCEKISLGTSSKSVDDYASVQRFASPELADEIKSLIQKYQGENNVLSYLLRMIWQGRIKQVLPEAKLFSLSHKAEKYIRISAIRATKEIGSKEDFNEILKSFKSEEGKHDRRVLAEIVRLIDSTEQNVTWILEVLENAQDKKRYSMDGLSEALANFVDRSDLDILSKLIKGVDTLLRYEPVVERRYCQISARFSWLMPISVKAIERLILKQHPISLSAESLFALTLLPAFQDYNDFESNSIKLNVSTLIPEWSELNHRLFWKSVEETRNNFNQEEGERLIYYWQAGIFRQYWKFNEKDFDLIIKDITGRSILDDKLVALSLAFQLYKENNRPKRWLAELKKVVSNNQDLEKCLKELLRPPAQSPERKKFKLQQAQWKRRDNERKKKQEEEHAKSREWLKENYQKLKDNGLERGHFSNSQYYLHERMRSYNRTSSKWTNGNWKDLIDDYGSEVALAFKDGLLNFWRGYTPTLRSEKDDTNSTPFAIIFGLSGLEVESTETINWPQNLSKSDAELACRYALHELNGFPDWFPRLYINFPDVVTRLILNEIDWELRSENQKEPNFYVLSKISWDCEWIWNDIAQSLLRKAEKEPLNFQSLGLVLKIIQRSTTVSDKELCDLAANKCKAPLSENTAYWYAAWIGIDPAHAIKTFSTYLFDINKNDKIAAKDIAMHVLVKLVGERGSGSSARENYKTPIYLQKLYLLMHQYIKVEEDIDRSGKGAYSPTLRDDAQEARSGLFSMLKDIPGKESYIAMVELSKTHPVQAHRVWMMNNAKERAELDADIPAWTSDKFSEFSKVLESTPANHKELFDLGVQRLLDLKYDLEEGDESIASILAKEDNEKEIRKYISGWCRDRASGKYVIPQEEELADAKKPDSRFLSSLFDSPVPLELKLADNWTGPSLFERLENQLCGDYLRDSRSSLGIFVLVYRGDKSSWEILGSNKKVNFLELVDALQSHWEKISINYPKIEQIRVIGIDLTKRFRKLQEKI